MSIESFAKKLGYKICYTNVKSSHVNHTLKCIFTFQNNCSIQHFQLSHELGHCVIYRITKNAKKSFLNELMAWIIGLYVCFKCKIKSKGFFKEATKCLKTYIK